MKTVIKYAKAIPYIIIVGLIIALCVTQCSKQKVKLDNHESELRQAIQVEKKRVIDLANREQTLIQKLNTDSVKSSRVVVALKIENKALRLEVKKAKTIRVVEIINENPELDKFIDLQDSLIANLDATVDTLELQKVRQWKSFSEILSVNDQKFAASQEINTHYVDLNESLYKSVRKERRRKTVWKIAAGILATGILYQSIQK